MTVERDLFKGAEKNDLLLIEKCLSIGVNVNSTIINNFGSSALIVAIHYQNFEAVKFLVKAGANVNYRNKYGTTALLAAVQYGYCYDIIEYLVGVGADIDISDNYGYSTLQLAAKYGDPAVIQLIINQGKKVDGRNSTESTSFFNARTVELAKALAQAVIYNNIDAAKLLVRYGANVNTFVEDKVTVLMKATLNRNLEMIKLLVNSGANIATNSSETAWSVAYYNYFDEITKYFECAALSRNIPRQLFKKKSKGERKEFSSSSSSSSGSSTVSILNANQTFCGVQRGVKQSLRLSNPVGIPVSIAPTSNLDSSFFDHNNSLVAQCPTVTSIEAIFDAVSMGRVDLVRDAIQKGLDVNCTNDANFTMLMVAAERNDTDLVKLLIESGADIDIKYFDRPTAVVLASRSYHHEVVKLFLDSGIDINDKANDLSYYSGVNYSLKQTILRFLRWKERKNLLLFVYTCNYHQLETVNCAAMDSPTTVVSSPATSVGAKQNKILRNEDKSVRTNVFSNLDLIRLISGHINL